MNLSLVLNICFIYKLSLCAGSWNLILFKITRIAQNALISSVRYEFFLPQEGASTLVRPLTAHIRFDSASFNVNNLFFSVLFMFSSCAPFFCTVISGIQKAAIK